MSLTEHFFHKIIIAVKNIFQNAMCIGVFSLLPKRKELNILQNDWRLSLRKFTPYFLEKFHVLL